MNEQDTENNSPQNQSEDTLFYCIKAKLQLTKIRQILLFI